MRLLILFGMVLGSMVGKAQDSVLIGRLSINELGAVAGWEGFSRNYDQYSVQANKLAELKPYLTGVKKVYLFIGTWCSDSQEQLPGIWKVLTELGLQNKCELIGVNREKNQPADWLKAYGAKLLPTVFWELENGQVISVMEETPKLNFESDLLSKLLLTK
ncbi:MAG: hypothetical protein K1X82_04780 [Bacteroidia bacterium]|nr:hypothetical protein [Bacteroidia bacterium]